MVDTAFWQEIFDLEDELNGVLVVPDSDQTDTLKPYFDKAENIDVESLPEGVKVFELHTGETFIYAVGYDSEEAAEQAYLEQSDDNINSYFGITEVTDILQELLNDETPATDSIQIDAGSKKVKGNLCRDAKGRFAACGGGGSSSSSGGSTSSGKAAKVAAPKTISTKTNIAQLRAIAEAEGVKLPSTGLSRRQTYIDAIEAKVGDKYKPGKKKAATETKKPEEKKKKAETKTDKKPDKKTESEKKSETDTGIKKLRAELDEVEAKFVSRYREAEEAERQAIRDLEEVINKGKTPSRKLYEARKKAEADMLDIRKQASAERKALAHEYVKNNRSASTTEIDTHGMAQPEKMWSIKSGGLTLHGTGDLTENHVMVSYFIQTAGKEDFPEEFIKHTKNVYMTSNRSKHDEYWAKEYNSPGFESGATGGDGNIVTYNARGIDRDILTHEAGHNFATARYGKTHPPEDSDYGRAWKEEGLNKLSSYAHNNIAEDFAETARMFFNRDPKTIDIRNHDNLKKDHPKRYAVFKRLIEDENYLG